MPIQITHTDVILRRQPKNPLESMGFFAYAQNDSEGIRMTIKVFRGAFMDF